MQNNSPSHFYRITLILICLIFLAALGSIFFMGSTSRAMADDYCYATVLRGNFWERQLNAYMTETTFSGNRFSLTLFTGISELFGPRNIQVLPEVILILWLGGLYFFSRQLPGLDGKNAVSRLEAFAVAEALELFTLGMATNWVQVYFWRAGMFPYLAPLITASFLLGFLVKSARRGKLGWPAWIAVFVLALLTGGFSEVAVVVELAALLAALVLVGVFKRWKKGEVIPFVIALAGCLMAFALIISSPMNHLRMQRSYVQYAPLAETLINAINGGVTFYLTVFYRQPLYFLSLFLFFTLFSWIIFARGAFEKLSLLKSLIWLIGTMLLTYLITVAAMVPGFYAESSYPSDRALVIPHFVSLLGLLVTGGLIGQLISQIRSFLISKIILVVSGLLVLGSGIFWIMERKVQFHPPAYPELRTFFGTHLTACLLGAAVILALGLIVIGKNRIPLTISILLAGLCVPAIMIGARFISEYPLMKERAALWDGRDAQIKALKEEGQTDLIVPAMNSLTGILELSDSKDFWVNHCAAAYYGVNSISAVQPVLDAVQLTSP